MRDSAAREVVAPDLPGCEGAAFDARGELRLAPVGTNRIVRVEPDGAVATLMEYPTGERVQGPLNCAFGRPHRRTLYIANRRGSLPSNVELQVGGQPVYGPMTPFQPTD